MGMVGLVLVAHSRELLRGLRAMVGQAAPPVPVACAAGTATGALGTSSPAVLEALHQGLAASDGDGVVVLIDLGSALFAVEMAIEELSTPERERVRLSGAPLVEGAVLAAVEAATGANLEGVASAADVASTAPKLMPS